MTRKLAVVAGVVALLGAAAAVVSVRSIPAPPAVVLRTCMFPVQDFLPYFVMRERGLATRHGLRFEETTVPGGGAAIDGLAAGTLDVCPAIGFVPILAAAERGVIPGRARVVAANDLTDPEHRTIAIVAAPNIKTVADLRGREIATNERGSISAAAAAAWLQHEGVADVTFVKMSFANMGLAVAGGNVAAATMNEPFLTQAIRRGDGHLLAWIAGGPPLARAPLTSIVVSVDLLQRRPDAVKAFLRAHLDAVGWISRNPDATRQVLARSLDLSGDLGQHVHLARWPTDARNDAALIDGMQPVLVRAGLLKAPLPARSLYDESLLEQVLAERR